MNAKPQGAAGQDDELSSTAQLWLRQVVEGFMGVASNSDAYTEWFSGDLAPVHIGWYERHPVGKVLRHWWDGRIWRAAPEGLVCLHQVGGYPCWRGLRKPAQTKLAHRGAFASPDQLTSSQKC